ncbi:protein adenylyltransferase SelO family protein, partial [Paraburkholderia sp. SIMBA_061]
SYARLPERFYARVQPAQVRDPKFLRVNKLLGRELGLDPDQLESDAALQVFAGNHVPASADPIAQAYAGHQFGNWVPQLGDGRA